MPDHARRRALAGLTSLAALAAFAPRAPAASPGLTAAQLQADLAFLRKTLADTHPDPRFSVDPAALDAGLAGLAARITDGMTRDAAWALLATINPLFADAHLCVTWPDWRGAVRAHLDSGGTLFPYEVTVDANGLAIDTLLGGAATPLRGARIVAIDGEPAGAVTAALLARMHGDTARFRMHLLGRRWWFYHWKLRGAPASHHLTLTHNGRTWTVFTPASTATPDLLQQEASFERQFRLDFEPDGSAVLTVGSFGPTDPARVQAFLREAFATLRERRTRSLVIDISANGGGDDAVWLDGLLPCLATRPYRTGSTYRKKVLETNAAKGERAGDVVTGEITTWRPPQPDHPLRFAGKVRVVIGPATYSSAILFANVMRDFGFATLAGTGGAARRAQSGGVRNFTLPNSGLALSVPRFVLDPPAGGPPGALLEPDKA